MLLENEQQEKIVKNHSKFVPRLSQEEKDVIERIAGNTGYKFKTVQDIFLNLHLIYGMQINKDKDKYEIHIPYLFKIQTFFDADYKSGKRSLITSFTVEPYYALKNLVEKIGKKENSWLHEYFKTNLRNFVSKALDVRE